MVYNQDFDLAFAFLELACLFSREILTTMPFLLSQSRENREVPTFNLTLRQLT